MIDLAGRVITLERKTIRKDLKSEKTAEKKQSTIEYKEAVEASMKFSVVYVLDGKIGKLDHTEKGKLVEFLMEHLRTNGSGRRRFPDNFKLTKIIQHQYGPNGRFDGDVRIGGCFVDIEEYALGLCLPKKNVYPEFHGRPICHYLGIERVFVDLGGENPWV